MSYIHFVSGTGLLLIFSTGLSAQAMPRKPTPQQFAGYYVKQQQNWQVKQLPANSVTYRFTATNQAVALHDFTTSKVKPMIVSVPASAMNSRHVPNKYMPAPSLQSYLANERQQNMKEQKQSWWKDPQQAAGAEMIRSFIMSNRRN